MLNLKDRKCLWSEDECTISDPQHEYLEKAYKRLFGIELKDDLISEEPSDGPEVCLYTNNALVIKSFPGDNAIYEKVSI